MTPTVSLAMIVRDCESRLAAALAGATRFDEIVVVDTGSQDQTIRVAKDSGANVVEFPWCDDFAAARNESLRHVTSDWIFWMDSDDVMDEDNGCKLRQLVDGLDGTSPDAFVMQVHCPSPEGVTVVDQVKLFRNRPDYRFEGRLHEQILGSIRRAGGRIAWTDIFVVHANADVSPEGHARKLDRDLRILALELADKPDCPFTLFNLGMTLCDADRHDEALGPLCRSLHLSHPSDSHVRKVYALLASAYSALGRTDAAFRTCEQGLAVCPSDPELTFRKASLALDRGELLLAERLFHNTLRTRREEKFGSYDTSITGYKSWQNLALVYEELGDLRQAAGAWRQVAIERPERSEAWLRLIDAHTVVRGVEALLAVRDEAASAQRPDIVFIASSALAMLEGDTATGLAALKQAIPVTADPVPLLHRLCRFAFEHEMVDEAEFWLSRLLELQPDNPSVYQNIAAVYLRQGRYRLAADHASRSLRLRPDHAPATAIAEEAHRRLAEHAESEEDEACR